ncbi:MAG: EpsI family protein [Deltaproteobacteria bacterium]|nr:EpsI family protein [Deltaproteobacteria bacterium]
MGIAKKALMLGCLLYAQALAIAWLGSSSAMPYDGTRIITDLHLEGWSDIDITDRTGILDQLEADASVFKEFRNARGEQVVLYVGYYDTLQKAKMSHAPQVCFTGQGWVLEGKDKEELQSGDSSVMVNRMVVGKAQEREVVYFWYQSPDRILADLFLLKLDMLKNTLLTGDRTRGRNAFVRVSTRLGADEKATEEQLRGFVWSAMPRLQTRLFARQGAG